MEIQWLKYSPAGNMTALVSTQVPGYQRADVGRAIMRMDPEVEQVGFLEPPHWPECSLRLTMAGGEFCGGAVLAAAADAVTDWLSPGYSTMFPVEAGEVPDFLTVMVQGEEDSFRVTLELPLPSRVDTAALSFGGKSYQMPQVRFPGINYVILPGGSMERDLAEEAIREWCRVTDAEAMGMLFYTSSTGEMDPLIYVPAANTLCWERSCAGGSGALGAFLSTMARSDLVTQVKQPGGVVSVKSDFRGGRLQRVAVSADVKKLTENMLVF